MIFKGVREGKPYPDHGLSQRQWAQIPPRQIRLDDADEAIVGIHDVDDGRVIHQIVVAVAHFLEIDPTPLRKSGRRVWGFG